MGDKVFRNMVLRHWRTYGRHDLPWRATTNAYHILVSEIMLQQTQVERVIPFYKTFLNTFPTFRVLARATPAAVLKVWQGLGYNRRALMLLQCARVTTDVYKGILPDAYETLVTLPGIGPYTASAILAFAFNMKVPMIETNIRRAYLHHYFPKKKSVSDSEILKVVIHHLKLVTSPSQWYSALMDYGAWLATTMKNPNVRSKHFVRQAVFEGSRRQLRGTVVRVLVVDSPMLSSKIAQQVYKKTPEINVLMATLEKEGFVTRCAHPRCVHNPHWSLR